MINLGFEAEEDQRAFACHDIPLCCWEGRFLCNVVETKDFLEPVATDILDGCSWNKREVHSEGRKSGRGFSEFDMGMEYRGQKTQIGWVALHQEMVVQVVGGYRIGIVIDWWLWSTQRHRIVWKWFFLTLMSCVATRCSQYHKPRHLVVNLRFLVHTCSRLKASEVWTGPPPWRSGGTRWGSAYDAMGIAIILQDWDLTKGGGTNAWLGFSTATELSKLTIFLSRTGYTGMIQ